MTPAAVIASLGTHGVRLYLADGALRARGPEGAYTPELRELVGANREAIVATLAAANDAQHHTAPSLAPGYSPRPFDVWSVDPDGDLDPVGSFATLEAAQAAVAPLTCGVVLLGGEPRWWHPSTTTMERVALELVVSPRWRRGVRGHG